MGCSQKDAMLIFMIQKYIIKEKKIPETFKEMVFVRNIFNDEALINLTKTSRMGMLVQSTSLLSDLEIALIGVKDDGFLFVEFPHHFNGQSTNGGLKVRLFSVNHHPHVLLDGILQKKRCWMTQRYSRTYKTRSKTI